MKSILALILLLLVITPAIAEENDCEKLAKDYQKANYGDLIFIIPLKDNGAYDTGDLKGHWLNKAWSSEMGNYYYDEQQRTYMRTEKEVLNWYYENTGRRAALFNINRGGAPFPIKYLY